MGDIEATLARLASVMRASRERAEAILQKARADHAPEPLPATIEADHPLARAIGLAKAQQLADAMHGKPMVPASFTTELCDLVLRMSLAGSSRREIAEAAGCSIDFVDRVRRHLRDRGDYPAEVNRCGAKERRGIVLRMSKANRPRREIAAAAKCSVNYVSDLRRRIKRDDSS